MLVVNHWLPYFTKRYGHYWPRTYMCIDTEYTGGNADKDLIVEVGHCIVEDGVVVDSLNLVLDWTQSTIVPRQWLSRRLAWVKNQVGVGWTIDEAKMQREGVDAIEGLKFYYQLLQTWKKRNLPFVAHNGYFADEHMLDGNFSGFISKRFSFGEDLLLDTGAIYKATRFLESPEADDQDKRKKMLPQANDSLRDYFKRVTHVSLAGIKWNLLACLDHYDLVNKRGINTKTLHNAGNDARCTHYLMEEFFSLITHNNDPGTCCEDRYALERTITEELAKATQLNTEKAKTKES
jgi:DNA polymerase III epsilon subunit-like protein